MRYDDRPGLYCVEIRSRDWLQAAHWYRDVLGLRVLVRVPDEKYALLAAGETRLAILGRDQPGEATRRISLAFEVPDLAPLVERLHATGAQLPPPHTSDEGLREINLVDPDGNRLRLFSWPRGPSGR